MKIASIFTLILFALPVISNAQVKTIKGKVINESGDPIAFATVLASSKIGASADSNGNFILEYADFHDTVSLTCSHVNYSQKIVKVPAAQPITIILSRNFRKYFSTFSVFLPYKEPQRKLISKPVKNPDGSYKVLDDENKVFTKVEVQSYWERSSIQDLVNNILSKDLADSSVENEMEGMITARFTIDKNGKVKNPWILKGLNAFANQAVIRALNKIPNSIPAQQNGRYVDSEVEINVYFNIEIQIQRR
jgi:hypothetical protein